MTRSLGMTMTAVLVSASSLCAADLFPLQAGNTWTYRERSTGQEFTVRVGTPVQTGDRVYNPVSGYVETRLLVRQDERNALVFLDEDSGAERLLTSFEPLEGAWWQAPFRQCDQEGQAMDKRGVHEGDAGPISDVVELRYRSFGCADAGTESEQYAANIGMVRRVTGSIAGPREFNLVSARVGKLVIDALPHGRFSVSAGTATTLWLSVGSSASIRLAFPTAQEYDVILKDEAGTIVWKWSDGQVFDQGSHERTVSADWVINVDVPKPTQGGRYTLQAWLTTSPDAPQFAATAPLLIGERQ